VSAFEKAMVENFRRFVDQLRVDENYTESLEYDFEGVSLQNTELEKKVSELQAEIEQRKVQYKAAITMIENREKDLQTLKARHSAIVKYANGVIEGAVKARESVSALKNVPLSHLDDAIDTVVYEIGTALETGRPV